MAGWRMTRQGAARPDKAQHDETKRDKAQHDQAGPGATSPGAARQGRAKRGEETKTQRGTYASCQNTSTEHCTVQFVKADLFKTGGAGKPR